VPREPLEEGVWASELLGDVTGDIWTFGFYVMADQLPRFGISAVVTHVNIFADTDYVFTNIVSPVST
jgi:hypothetical protein